MTDSAHADIAAQLENAPIAPDASAGKAPTPLPDPPAAPPRDADGRPKGEIWEGCPIVPLGVKGTTYYYLDAQRQIIGIGKHAVQDIMGLFGHLIPQLCWHFPKWVKDPDTDALVRAPNQFQGTLAAMAMITACGEKGLFEPDGAVRGVGAWRGSTGQLIWHRGDALIVDGEDRPPGPFDGRIYPAYPAIPGPAPQGDYADPIAETLKVARSWVWEYPETDPYVVLGMIGLQKLGGAVKWKPTFWLTAAAGSGKSAFQDWIEFLHGGPRGLVKSSDPTKSGITSRLGYGSIPVSIDEAEPSSDDRSNKARDLIELARLASSGGQWLRGSSDQKGAGGNVYSTFLFSSIIIPGVMKAQDVQRLIRLDLNPLPRDTKPLDMREGEWHARGAVISRILIDRWPSWEVRLATYRQGLALAGVTGRDSDNWSTVLAMADMMQREALPSVEEAEGWGKAIAKRLDANRPEVMTDSEGMLQHLMGRTYDPFRRSEQYNIAQWVMTAAELPSAIDSLRDSGPERQLAKCGLRVEGKGFSARLFIANSASIQPLGELFHGSQWAGGSWSQSARRVEGAEPVKDPLTLAGIRSRGYWVPFSAVPGLCAFPTDKTKPPQPVVDPSITYSGDEYA